MSITPNNTKHAPKICQAVKNSSSNHAPKAKVITGLIALTNADCGAPIRRMPCVNKVAGKKVQKKPNAAQISQTGWASVVSVLNG